MKQTPVQPMPPPGETHIVQINPFKTPAKGDIDHPPPAANTQAEIQETWHKSKNHPTPITHKKDPI